MEMTTILILALALLLVAVAFWIHHDYVERKRLRRMQRQIIKLKKQADSAERQMIELLSIATHQFRTPLSIIKGFTELIEEGAYGKPTRKMKHALVDINEANERLIGIVNDFLNIARLEQGRISYKFASCNIGNIAKEVQRDLADRAKAKGIKIVVKRSTTRSVAGDCNKIYHIISNLVDNAIKYTSKGTITVSVNKHEEGVCVMIKDKGIGFDEKDSKQFFHRFCRGENTKDTCVVGNGLGLYICREFVEAHGGRIWAESPGLEKGSTFSFWLPQYPKNRKT